MSATSIDLSQIKTDALSAASTFRTLIGLGTGDTPTFKAATLSAGTLNGTVLDIAQTWGGTGTYTGIRYNVTDSGPANAASLLMDLQVGGTSKCRIRKDGVLFLQGATVNDSCLLSNTNIEWRTNSVGTVFQVGESFVSNGWAVQVGALGSFSWRSTNRIDSGSADVILWRDAAGTLAQRNGTSAQTFRIYNTYTDANNYERAKIAWSSNVLQIGTEKLGTGSARALELQTDGTTRLTIASTGAATFSSSLQANKIVFGGADVLTWTGSTAELGSSSWQDLNFRLSSGLFAKFSSSLLTFYKSVNFAVAQGVWLQVGGVDTSSYVDATNELRWGGIAASSYWKLLTFYADGTKAVDITSSNITLSTNLTLSTKNLVTDTTTGTKIGTATTQKLGFYNSTPVVQPAAVADATDAASVITQLNLLLARMRDLGLIAT